MAKIVIGGGVIKTRKGWRAVTKKANRTAKIGVIKYYVDLYENGKLISGRQGTKSYCERVAKAWKEGKSLFELTLQGI
jgi:uncharacterized protein YbcV (DUF1398 family)